MWRLRCERGQQVWYFDKSVDPNSDEAKEQRQVFQDFDRKENPNSGDKVYRAMALRKNYKKFQKPSNLVLPADQLGAKAFMSAIKGIDFYEALQDDDGHWPADYGGPMFLMPGMVITLYVTKTIDQVLTPMHKEQMKRYLANHQSQEGGWGLHIEGPTTMFGTALNYVTLRLLGMSKNHEVAKRARAWIKANGGAVLTPSWGKFWLCVLGVFDWSGVNSLFPELWLLPESLPVHPWRYWCHCRMVYLPMAYCYGVKLTAEIGPLIESLREELFVEPYEEVAWHKYRDEVTKVDRYVDVSWVCKALNMITNTYEHCHFKFLRKRATDFIAKYVDAEDNQTDYVDIGPVNKVINTLVVYHNHGHKSKQFKRHIQRMRDYLWLAEDGMKMQGYNGSQLWDCTFAVQAIVEALSGQQAVDPDKPADHNSKQLLQRYKKTLEKAYHYIDISQVREDTPNREQFYRHLSNGAWPFSTRDHGWPISDCTSEGIKATIALHHTGLIHLNSGAETKTEKIPQTITKERLCDAVNVILSFQNSCGGWATYENTRGSPWLELLNPSEVFGDIIIDYSYVECSSACMQSLVKFQRDYPDHRKDEIDKAVRRGAEFIKSIQRKSGGWYGSWAVCFCYGTWFGVCGLLAAGEKPSCPAIQKACQFLVSHQKDDGGWGESYESSVKKEYIEHERSLVVNTSWALLTLMAAEYPDREVLRRGVEFLLRRQLDTGDWAQEAVSGVFNGNCMITYTAYRNVFPIWALGRFANLYLADSAKSKPVTDDNNDD